jgi:hypothetical protein
MIAILFYDVMLIVCLVFCIDGVYKDIDWMLNYSMKRKVKWGPFKNLYKTNRIEETIYGPATDKPNCGTYFPAFMLILLHSIIVLVAIIWSLILIFTGYMTGTQLEIMIAVTFGAFFIITCFVAATMHEVYKRKYFKHRSENARKLSQLLEEKNK